MKPAPDKAYLAWIHEQRCIAAGHADSPCSGRITAHHVRRYGSAREDKRALPLCIAHHLHDAGNDSIERGKERFEKRFGVDLEALIVRCNVRYFKETAMSPMIRRMAEEAARTVFAQPRMMA